MSLRPIMSYATAHKILGKSHDPHFAGATKNIWRRAISARFPTPVSAVLSVSRRSFLTSTPPAPAPTADKKIQMSLPNDGKLTGDKLPEVTLHDGSKVQTGTAARLVVSIHEYNSVCAADTGGAADAERKQKLEQLAAEMELAIPALHKVGLLGLFSIEEWIGDGSNKGRAELGRLYEAWLKKNVEQGGAQS